MKKAYLVVSTLFCLAAGSAMGQYQVLHAFNKTAGLLPQGALTLSGKVLYGTTTGGGASGRGTIFSIDTNGNNFKDIHNFTGGGGAFPSGGSLKISGNKLFGMTYSGGAHDSGCVFSMDTNGAAFKDLFDFTGPNGSNAYGSLTLVGNKLFGMTNNGGANVLGNVFTVDTTGKNYKDLVDFDGIKGANPYGDITVIGGKLYGMASSGGAYGAGDMFSVDSNGTNFVDLYDFDGIDASAPNNLLELSGTQFFGMTYAGGAGLGNVFSIDTSGTAYKDLLGFNGGSYPYGEFPVGDVIFNGGNVLYGMTSVGGGLNDSGCIFMVDTNGSNYKDLFDFSGPNGDAPVSDVLVIGGSLYGTTSNGGGSNYAGVIFKYNTAGLGINNLKNQVSVNIYPNPSNGVFNITFGHAELVSASQTKIEIYNMLGEQVLTETLRFAQGDNLINLSDQSNGVYLYKIISDNGNLVGQGKLVIQK